MNTNNFNLQLTLILVEDPKIGGYTAFFKQFPNIISEGESEKEAENNLKNAVHDVFKYQGNYPTADVGTCLNVKEKPVNFMSYE